MYTVALFPRKMLNYSFCHHLLVLPWISQGLFSTSSLSHFSSGMVPVDSLCSREWPYSVNISEQHQQTQWERCNKENSNSKMGEGQGGG